MSKITTLHGRTIDIFNLTKDDIHAEDILIPLGNICRYGGRCREFYSVADHTLNLTQYFVNKGDLELARIALLHDACEAYIGDIIWPIKIKIPEFEKLETDISNLIYEKYNVDYSRFEEFDKYDKNIVIQEMKLLGLYEHNKHLITHLTEIEDIEVKNLPNKQLVLSALTLAWIDLLNDVPNFNIK